MTTSFLKPRSVIDPPQGALQYSPEIFGYEGDTLAELVTAMNAGAGIQAVDPDNFYVVESVEYQVAVTKPAIGMTPAEMKYSALVWATRCERI